MAEQDESQLETKEAQIRAKQAISPAGLGDQSVEGHSGPGSEMPLRDAPPSELEEKYVEEGPSQEPAENVHLTHPNRNAGGKTDSGKPSYA